jgi:hypothetical protein
MGTEIWPDDRHVPRHTRISLPTELLKLTVPRSRPNPSATSAYRIDFDLAMKSRIGQARPPLRTRLRFSAMNKMG